jgi:hypothetical protein
VAQYEWKPGSRLGLSAQTAGEELERIAALSGGIVTPRSVVEESRPPTAPLHPVFEWEDRRAATLFRESQARAVIRSVRVLPGPEEEERPAAIAYVHVQTQGQEGYCSTARVMAEPELREQALAEALALLEGVRRRFEALGELREVFAALDAVRERQAAAQNGSPRRHPARQRAGV